MTTTTVTDPAPILATWTTQYGIPASDIGEDGDIALAGHHDERRVVAALHRHARTTWGREYATADALGTPAEIAHDLEQRWADDHARYVADSRDGTCALCTEIAAEIADGGWSMAWQLDWTPVTEATPGAFPITLWRTW